MKPVHPPKTRTAPVGRSGFTLVELLISMVVMSIVMVGVANFFGAFKRATRQEEMTANVEANLRVAMEQLSYSLRNAGSGVPPVTGAALAAWIPWVTSFTNRLSVTQGSGTNPDRISIAYCTPKPIATLSAAILNTATSISLTSAVSGKTIADLLNDDEKLLIRIGDSDFAHVTADPPGGTTVDGVNTAAVAIDSAPTNTGDPANLTRGYTAGTPVYRVDVLTFDLDTSSRSFRINEHHGGGAQPSVDGITNLQIAVNGVQYTITLTGQSDRKDPETNAYFSRDLTSTITLRQ